MATRHSAVDVVVVGGGIIGAAIAFELSSKGIRVAVLEKGIIGGALATSRSGGIIRCYHPHPAIRAMAATSVPWFEEWKDRVGGDCGFHAAGVVILGGSNAPDRLQQAQSQLGGFGIEIETVSEDRLAKLLPGINQTGLASAAFEQRAGYADPVLVTRGFLDAARRRSTRIMEGTTAVSIQLTHGRATGVVTEFGLIPAASVVLANGVGTSRLASALGRRLPLNPLRVAAQFLGHSVFTARVWPAWIDEITGGYGRGVPNGLMLVGAAADAPGCDPDTPEAQSEMEMTAVRTIAAHRFPFLASASYCGRRTGSDGYTPDKLPLVGPLPECEGVWVACGMSGGGVKISPAIGKMVAEMLTAFPQADCTAFAVTRFDCAA
jgi:sarcosine oxidase, subunit beta